MQPTRKQYNDIYISLLCTGDYRADEVEANLDTATFEEDEKGVTVKYSNGAIDRFIKVSRLVHESDIVEGD